MLVNTAKVQGRRKLDFASFEEVLTDAQQMSSSPVKALGNWSAGQIYMHLALVYSGSIDGLPMAFPWHFRFMARLFKKKLISGTMPPGFKLRPEAAKTMAPGPTSTEEGLAALRAAVSRLQRESHRIKHPLFGDISREEWDKLHLKHASLHMSFLVPG